MKNKVRVPIKTKEQLGHDIDDLNDKLQMRKSMDNELLREMGRILELGNIDDENNMFYGLRGKKLLTWPVVFAEIGKLKATKDFRDFEVAVENLHRRLDEMQKEKGTFDGK